MNADIFNPITEGILMKMNWKLRFATLRKVESRAAQLGAEMPAGATIALAWSSNYHESRSWLAMPVSMPRHSPTAMKSLSRAQPKHNT